MEPIQHEWECACGATGNTGRFCAECGMPKPGIQGGSEKEQSQPAPDGNVVSVSLRGGHMAHTSFYNFYLREKGGQVLLDARFWVSGRGEIALGNAVAAQEDMDALRALCERYNLEQRQKTYQKPKPGSGPFMHDAPMRSLEVWWENGARLDADIDFGNLDDLRAFFEALVLRAYEAMPRPEGDIVSLHIFSGDHFVKTNYYRFHIHEEEGRIRLDALYYLGDNEKFDEIRLEGAAISPEDMARLRGICARYDLAARQRTYAWPSHIPFDPIAQQKYGYHLEAVWANGARLDCEETFMWNGLKNSGLKEELKDYFVTLGNKLAL